MCNRKVRIGIDIDGVLRDFGFQFARYAKQFHGITLKADDFEDYGFKNVKVNGKPLVSRVFYDPQVAEFVFANAPTVTNAKSGYNMFVNNPKFDVYIVSNQKKSQEHLSDRWLEENGFTSHIKTFYERNKLKAPVQILLDDKPSHIEKFLENKRGGLLINAPYNQKHNSQLSIGRAEDLIDAYKKLSKRYN